MLLHVQVRCEADYFIHMDYGMEYENIVSQRMCINTITVFSNEVSEFQSPNQQSLAFHGIKPVHFPTTAGCLIETWGRADRVSLLLCWFKIRSEVNQNLELNLWVLLGAQAGAINSPTDFPPSLPVVY